MKHSIRIHFNPNTASLYRFCVRRLEIAGHLLSDCTELGKAEFSDTRSFELICIGIIQHLLKFQPTIAGLPAEGRISNWGQTNSNL